MEQSTVLTLGSHTLTSGEVVNFFVLTKEDPQYETLFWKGGAMAANLVDGTRAVLLLQEAHEALTEGELLAVLNHELGHIECGHLDNLSVQGCIINEQYEIEADAYALQFSSKRDLRNACYKLIQLRFGIKQRWKAAVQFIAPQRKRAFKLLF